MLLDANTDRRAYSSSWFGRGARPVSCFHCASVRPTSCASCRSMSGREVGSSYPALYSASAASPAPLCCRNSSKRWMRAARWMLPASARLMPSSSNSSSSYICARSGRASYPKTSYNLPRNAGVPYCGSPSPRKNSDRSSTLSGARASKHVQPATSKAASFSADAGEPCISIGSRRRRCGAEPTWRSRWSSRRLGDKFSNFLVQMEAAVLLYGVLGVLQCRASLVHKRAHPA